MIWILVPLLLVLALALLHAGRAFLAWFLPALVALGYWSWTLFAAKTSLGDAPLLFWIMAGAFALVGLLLGPTPLRRALFTPLALKAVAPLLPVMSETERTALEAGSVWFEKELFSGKPDWKSLLEFRPQPLSSEERAFLNGPVETLCRMLSDEEAVQRGDLPAEAWEYIRKQGFLGMIIPKAHGGLGFSAIAHSAVIVKLSSRCTTAAVSVMVPNSLGPAELLLHYGTPEQQRYYLPRLARGEETPCFALTEPGAGSDAGSIQSHGVVCKGVFEGREVLGMRLNWSKRYITLAPIATVVGLAFKLRDPEGLLGQQPELGITCALIPARLPGVEVGKRHDPLGVPFMNGTTFGKDVFVPLEFIIGGAPMAGKGWMMLMQSLAAGRGISLPSLSVGASQLCTRLVGAYASVREQFNTPIGRFEGIEEPLARIGALTYALDATRTLTAGAIDAGEKPSVTTAIVKAYSTETMRRVVNDAMDVLGGAGICRGPRNVLACAYAATPIGITVEGANILTRSMIIFGQGAIRCHPFAQEEMRAAAEHDVQGFDRAFFGHVGFVFTNAARALVLGASGARFASAPVAGPAARHFQRLTRLSSAFAFTADVCMGTLGGELKRAEKVTGRLADALSWMYLGSAALKRFVDAGQPELERAAALWVAEQAEYNVQQALLGVMDNFHIKPVGWLLRRIVFPTGARLRPPCDRRGAAVARGLLDGGALRERLTGDIYRPPLGEAGLGLIEQALEAVVAARPAERKLKNALRSRALRRGSEAEVRRQGLAEGVIQAAEMSLLERAEALRHEAALVDSFSPEQFRSRRS